VEHTRDHTRIRSSSMIRSEALRGTHARPHENRSEALRGTHAGPHENHIMEMIQVNVTNIVTPILLPYQKNIPMYYEALQVHF
jgi:hypothetical protein